MKTSGGHVFAGSAVVFVVILKRSSMTSRENVLRQLFLICGQGGLA